MRTSRGSEPARAVFLSRSPKETRLLAARLAGLLAGSETIYLHGGLGAGKTCFVQGLAAGLGSDAASPVASPTFTLVNEYQGRIPLCHVDLYRLERPDEVRALGLEEYFGRVVTAVEWAERMPPDLGPPTLEVTLTAPSRGERELVLLAGNPEGAGIIRRIRGKRGSRKKPG